MQMITVVQVKLAIAEILDKLEGVPDCNIVSEEVVAIVRPCLPPLRILATAMLPLEVDRVKVILGGDQIVEQEVDELSSALAEGDPTVGAVKALVYNIGNRLGLLPQRLMMPTYVKG